MSKLCCFSFSEKLNFKKLIYQSNLWVGGSCLFDSILLFWFVWKLNFWCSFSAWKMFVHNSEGACWKCTWFCRVNFRAACSGNYNVRLLMFCIPSVFWKVSSEELSWAFLLFLNINYKFFFDSVKRFVKACLILWLVLLIMNELMRNCTMILRQPRLVRCVVLLSQQSLDSRSCTGKFLLDNETNSVVHVLQKRLAKEARIQEMQAKNAALGKKVKESAAVKAIKGRGEASYYKVTCKVWSIHIALLLLCLLLC